MKKIFIVLTILLFLGMSVNAATLQTAITKYKQGNYVGCLADLDEVAKVYYKDSKNKDALKQLMLMLSKYDYKKLLAAIEANDVNNPDVWKFYNDLTKTTNINRSQYDKLAYMFYYGALCYHQVGANQYAQLYYSFAVLFSPQSQIADNSIKALDCLENPASCPASDMDEFIRSGKQVSDDIVKKDLQNNLQKHKEMINKNAGAQNTKPNMTPSATRSNIPGKTNNTTNKKSMNEDIENEKIAWLDKGTSTSMVTEDAKYSKADTDTAQPTDEEIGHAIRTLQKAGINPAPYVTSKMDNEYAQMNAILNDGYYYNNYNPMMYGNQKLSPEVMQTLMQQQMMNSYGSF